MKVSASQKTRKRLDTKNIVEDEVRECDNNLNRCIQTRQRRKCSLNCREQENGGGEANQRRERRRKGREHDQMTAASTVRGLSVSHWKVGAKAKSE